MNLAELGHALKELDDAAAAPELKDAYRRMLLDLVKKEVEGHAAEDLKYRRHHRLLKFTLGWLIVVGTVVLWAVGLSHALGIITIARPDQLPWIWGSAVALPVTSFGALMKYFYPTTSGTKPTE